MHVQHRMSLQVNRDGVIRRRDFLQGVSAAALAAGAWSWSDVVTVSADELRRRGMACILLFMRGGPSPFETLSPKPDHDNGGETKAISTAVPGIQIAENLPKLAGMTNELAIIRSMNTKEGAHPRAVYLMHTGYVPTPNVRYPTLGSIVAQQLPNPTLELPAFVRIGGRGSDSGAGFLGAAYDPFEMGNALRPPDNTAIPTATDRFRRRLNLLSRIDAHNPSKTLSSEHQDIYRQAARMVTSAQMRAFDLDKEPDKMRDAYGRTEFGSACLLARRLVESGVTFVEVSHGNWDSHFDNFNTHRRLCDEIDQPFATLLADLKERGMLEKTLVIWMGEFGRTPRVNPRAGRDHYTRAFNVALAGGGVRGGQVIGATDAGGVEITDRPVTEKDLFQSICKCLGIDASIENIGPIGRPLKIVDGGEVISELFS